MSKSFTIKLCDALPSVIKRVETEIKSAGGDFNGDAEKGSFAGKSLLGHVKGQYRGISENEIMITITDKPLLVPDSMIESEIRKHFS
jgi:hypothetical protein